MNKEIAATIFAVTMAFSMCGCQTPPTDVDPASPQPTQVADQGSSTSGIVTSSLSVGSYVLGVPDGWKGLQTGTGQASLIQEGGSGTVTLTWHDGITAGERTERLLLLHSDGLSVDKVDRNGHQMRVLMPKNDPRGTVTFLVDGEGGCIQISLDAVSEGDMETILSSVDWGDGDGGRPALTIPAEAPASIVAETPGETPEPAETDGEDANQDTHGEQ